MPLTHPLLPALLAGTVLLSVPALARAQDAGAGTGAGAVAAALPTGFFFRTGFVMSSVDLDGLAFRQRDFHGPGRTPSLPGKDLGLRHALMTGVSLGLHVDARWVYVRIGADLYQPPTSDRSDENTAQVTTLVWAGAGGRLPLGAFALTAGLRLGALLLNARQTVAGLDTFEYGSVSGLYAGDLGVQWRPLRWFEVDATVGQDLGRLNATTASLTVNFGWSHSAARTP